MRTRALASPLLLAACLVATAGTAQAGGAWPPARGLRDAYAQAQQHLVPLLQGQRPFGPPGQGGRMSREERERLREDLRATDRDQYRRGREHTERADEGPQRERERWREERMRRKAEAGRLTPEERDRLRRDVLDANRGLRR
jgi:hypothetical protein